MTDQQIKAEWDSNPAIRQEFGEFEIYAAYRKAAAAGRIKVLAPAAQAPVASAQQPTADALNRARGIVAEVYDSRLNHPSVFL